MKKIITILILCISLAANAQVTTDSAIVGYGPTYSTDVFYSFSQKTVATRNSDRWDLAFESALRGASVFVNHARGILVYRVLNDTAWGSADSNGINNWAPIFNSDTTWEKGALNTSQNIANFDFGWGVYTGAPDYNVVGKDSVYILKIIPFSGPTTYKKVRIMTKFGYANSYLFRVANLNNTSDTIVNLPVGAYGNKNFAYFNVTNDSTLDLEPKDSSWDILFTKYIDLPYNQYEPPVIGVLSNKQVQAVKVPNVPDISAVNFNNYSSGLTTAMDEIGFNWKSYNEQTGQFHVLDSLVYFVKTTNGNVYKLWFTAFNDTTGRILFNYETVQLAGVSSIDGKAVQAGIYPNPASSNFNLVYTTPKTSDAEVNIFDISGRMVVNEKINVNEGLNVVPVSLNNISDGVYLVRVTQLGSTINQKIVVTK